MYYATAAAAGMAMGFPFTPFPMMYGLFGPGGGAAGAEAAKAVITTPLNPFMPFGGRGMVPEVSKDVMEGWTKWCAPIRLPHSRGVLGPRGPTAASASRASRRRPLTQPVPPPLPLQVLAGALVVPPHRLLVALLAGARDPASHFPLPASRVPISDYRIILSAVWQTVLRSNQRPRVVLKTLMVLEAVLINGPVSLHLTCSSQACHHPASDAPHLPHLPRRRTARSRRPST